MINRFVMVRQNRVVQSIRQTNNKNNQHLAINQTPPALHPMYATME
jgi:hypothetical protein